MIFAPSTKVPPTLSRSTSLNLPPSQFSSQCSRETPVGQPRVRLFSPADRQVRPLGQVEGPAGVGAADHSQIGLHGGISSWRNWLRTRVSGGDIPAS